jgi:RES domain-containing protein
MIQSFDKYPNTHGLRAHIKQAAPQCLRNWDAPVYRAVDLKWAKPADLLSGKGAFSNGSRWMAPGLTCVFYAATTEALALKESRRNIEHFAIKRTARLGRKPRVVVEIHASIPAIVDFQKLCQAMPWPNVDEVLSENWEEINARHCETLAQACGRIFLDLGYVGLIAPSSRDRRGRNLIVFPQRIPRGSLEIFHSVELEKWLAS